MEKYSSLSKAIFTVSLFSVVTSQALAAPTDVSIANITGADIEVVAPGDVDPSPADYRLQAYTTTARGGFVKNDFTITISAYNSMYVADRATIFAVAAGSTKGRAVFVGHSDGGSVTQCGDQLAIDTTNGAASKVAARLSGAAADDVNKGCVAGG